MKVEYQPYVLGACFRVTGQSVRALDTHTDGREPPESRQRTNVACNPLIVKPLTCAACNLHPHGLGEIRRRLANEISSTMGASSVWTDGETSSTVRGGSSVRAASLAPPSSDTTTVATMTWRLRISPRTKEDDYTLTDVTHRCGVVYRGGRDKWRETNGEKGSSKQTGSPRKQDEPA